MTLPFGRLLLATEHSDFDSGAEALAFTLAREQGQPLAVVLPLLSNAEFEMVAPALAARADHEAALRRLAVETAARQQGATAVITVRHGSELFAEVVAEARERGSDLLVIRRRGKRSFLANLMVGEMVGKVVGQAPCSVLVVPRAARRWERGVLVGVDPQAPVAACLAQAAALAKAAALPLRVVCVAADKAARSGAELALAAAVQQARAAQAEADGEVRIGRAHEALLAAARERAADLIVVSRQGGPQSMLARLGSTTQKVIGLAECAVLVHVSPGEVAAR